MRTTIKLTAVALTDHRQIAFFSFLGFGTFAPYFSPPDASSTRNFSPTPKPPPPKPTVPSSPPSEIKAAALDSRSIRIEWQPPPLRQHNGVIVKYVIKYQKQPSNFKSSSHSLGNTSTPNPVNYEDEDENETDANSLSEHEETVDPTARNFVMKNLEEWTEYRITLSAGTKIGLGPWSPDLFVRTDESGMFYFTCNNSYPTFSCHNSFTI